MSDGRAGVGVVSGVVRGVAVCVAALALSGCWYQQGFGSTRQHANPFESSLTAANAATLAPLWTVDGRVDEAQPLVTSGAVVTTMMEQHPGGEPSFVVVARERASGVEIWRRALPVSEMMAGTLGSLISTGPDNVVVGHLLPAGGTEFLALDPATGATVATVSEDQLVDLDNVAVDGSVLAYAVLDSPNWAERIVVRSRTTFEARWSSADLVWGTARPALIAEGWLYTQPEAEAPGAPHLWRAFAIDGCGAQGCSPAFVGEVPPPDGPAGFRSSELLGITDDARLLVRQTWHDNDTLETLNDLVAIDRDGSHAWTLPLRHIGGVAIDGQTVFVAGMDAEDASERSGLIAVDATSGSVQWRTTLESPNGQPVVAGTLVYVPGDYVPGDGSGISVLPADGCGATECTPITTAQTGLQGFPTGMSVVGGTVYVSSTAGTPTLVALRPTSGP